MINPFATKTVTGRPIYRTSHNQPEASNLTLQLNHTAPLTSKLAKERM